MPEPSELFSDQKKLVSDLNTFAKFPVEGPISNLAAVRAGEILALKPICIGQDGNLRTPRYRELSAAIRAVIAMIRVNQDERNAIAGLTGAQLQIMAAIQINVDTKTVSDEDEVLNDLIARTTAETRAILDGLGRTDQSHSGDERPHLDRRESDGRGSPDQPA